MAAAKEAARFKTTKTDRIAQESAKKLTAARRGASVVKKARIARVKTLRANNAAAKAKILQRSAGASKAARVGAANRALARVAGKPGATAARAHLKQVLASPGKAKTLKQVDRGLLNQAKDNMGGRHSIMRGEMVAKRGSIRFSERLSVGHHRLLPANMQLPSRPA